jgi:uncharacterized protein (DUF427 family)
MKASDVTFVEDAIHRPDDPRHFMRVKPFGRRVQIRNGDTVLADTTRALRLLEAGRDLYDPVFYLPREDVHATVSLIDGKVWHCPLKGDSVFFDVLDASGKVAVSEAAWSYERTFDFAEILKDLIAFDGSKVTIVEMPDAA